MGPKEFKLSDSVLMRIVQIVQEGFLTGTDVADLMREIKLQESDSEGTLVMTDEYVELVKKSHEQLLARARELSLGTVNKAEYESLFGDDGQS